MSSRRRIRRCRGGCSARDCGGCEKRRGSVRRRRGRRYAPRIRRSSGIVFEPRSKSATVDLFAGTSLVEPGLVPVAAWRPELTDRPTAVADAESAWYWAGIGRKP
ncbi:SAM-dependent methyltransferase [Nocardia sp. NPDC004123]